MSLINVTKIEMLNNPAPFEAPINLQITFECLKEIPEEVEWKVIYVGSSRDPIYDQVLDCFTMGPLEFGIMQFDLETNPPDSTKIPKDELLGVTALILTASYREQEFFRVGYYVYNNYVEEELKESPPEHVILEKVFRNILADKPRITRFNIKWEDKMDEEEEDKAQVQTCESSQTKNQEESYSGLFSNMMSEGSQNLFQNFTPTNNPFLSSGNGFL